MNTATLRIKQETAHPHLSLSGDDLAWLVLETAIAQSRPTRVVSYGAVVYGGCLEPGYQLSDEEAVCECPDCGRHTAWTRTWERAEGGSLNTYHSLNCDACDLFETDYSEE